MVTSGNIIARKTDIPDYKIIPKVDLVCIQIFSSTKFPFSWAEIYLRGSIKDIFALFNIKK